MFDSDIRPVILDRRFGRIKLINIEMKFSPENGASFSESEISVEEIGDTTNVEA